MRLVATRDEALGGRLARFGLLPGERVVVIGVGPCRGPLLVRVSATGAQVAIGRSLGDAVVVEPAETE
jgi:Fe2+ transport system protein FeoA